MKVTLRYIGHYNIKKGDFDKKWSLGTTATSASTLGATTEISSIYIRSDEVAVYLKQIPTRVDISDKTAYIHDDKSAHWFSEPYKILEKCESHTIWLKGERELATVEEVGEPLQV